MEENNNQIKINLTTVIVLILLVVVIMIGVVFIIFTKNNKGNSGKTEIKNTIQNEDKQDDETKDNNTNYADTDFAFKFLKIENKKENMIYSPLSIKYALQMLNEGANGNTKKQIESVIDNKNIEKYNNINNVLSLANALYIRNSYSKNVKDEYKNKLLDKYNAEVKYDDFSSAYNINNWIENKTFGQIKNLLRDEIVQDKDNVIFLINALAIDMEWKEKFDAEDTHKGIFNLENGKEMNATMMHKETYSENISYYKDDKITVLSMDLKQYENEQMEFIAIMPNKDLSDYIENFEVATLNNITSNLTLASKPKGGLYITIPRFSFDYNLSLKDDLKTLGITDAFKFDIADFSNMSTQKPLWVGDALHKANIDFTEKGIKAAAVTVIYMTSGMVAIEDKPIEIKIDKPFMYIIRDKKTGDIWFVGTVYEPNSWESNKADYEYR